MPKPRRARTPSRISMDLEVDRKAEPFVDRNRGFMIFVLNDAYGLGGVLYSEGFLHWASRVVVNIPCWSTHNVLEHEQCSMAS
jgi:hypothetical protein